MLVIVRMGESIVNKLSKYTKSGFTLIELMIVVAIIGVLAAIAVPKFAELIKKAQEGRTKANLDQVRGSLNIYYGDTEGTYPTDDLSVLTTNAKYLAAMRPSLIPAFAALGNAGHAESATVNAVAAFSSATDTGVWQYMNVSSDANWGTFYVGCSHNDSKGIIWNTR